ncbi:15401_t:CDS:2, partial [Dentiscutata heterogama]
ALIRKVINQCWSIMLCPILKLEEIELTINRNQITFSSRISVFIADILEANKITRIYKLANCIKPCLNCIVYVKNLNNINLLEDNIIMQTTELIAYIIQVKKAYENLNIYEAILPNEYQIVIKVIILVVDGLFDEKDL